MGRKVTLISRESDNKTLDFGLLEKELLSRGIEVEVLTKLFRKELSLSQLNYAGHLAKQISAMNNSDLIILDTYCIPVSMLPHRDGLKVIQMWHALSAIKQFGWQTVGKEDGTSETVARTMKMHRGYDYVLCASDATAEHFCKGFGIEKNKIVKLGLPRIDYIIKDNKEITNAIYKKYPVLKNGKENILYAPTFHKGKPVDVAGLARELDFGKYNLIVKLHPIDQEISEHVVKEGVVYDQDFDTYDMLKVADVIVSDYSSFVVEATLADKPLYLYTYDKEEYKKTTGLNVDFDEEAIGKYAFVDAKELVEAMKRRYDYKALRKFRDKYIDIDTNNCTAQLADFIEQLLEEKGTEKKMGIAGTAKKKIFDLAKENKEFRVFARNGRDAVYRAKMTLDAPLARVDEKKVYFQTFSGRGYSDSPKALYEYMKRTPAYNDYTFVWSFRDPSKYDYLADERTKVVKFRSRQDNIELRTSKYWITNYRMLDHQQPRSNQVYVQCWHGTPLKRLGYDLEASDNSMNSIEEIREKYRTDAEKFSYIISPSPFCTEKFATAWNLVETGQTDKIIEEGYPRNDRLITTDATERKEIRQRLGVDKKKVILYAPTWRDNQHTSGTGYTYKTEVDFDKLRDELGEDYVILFRAHYLVANSFDFEKYKDFVVDVSGYSDINDLYIAADLLITDYSSVFFDYANLKKPMIFYMYDLEQYANELRGFYISLDELPGPIVQNEDNLVATIKEAENWKIDDKYKAFRKKYNPKDDGQAAARTLAKIIKK